MKYFLTRILQLIDNGKFFINPVKWLYTLNAWASFVIPVVILILYIIIYVKEGSTIGEMGTWATISAVLFMILFWIFSCIAAYLSYVFWNHRREKIDTFVKVGDQIVAIPLLAHYIQSRGEASGLIIAILPPVAMLLFAVWALISGSPEVFGSYMGADDILAATFCIIVVIIFLSFLFIFIGFSIILVSHFISEKIRLSAQIANDVRDLGDIHRAATFTEETKE